MADITSLAGMITDAARNLSETDGGLTSQGLADLVRRLR